MEVNQQDIKAYYDNEQNIICFKKKRNSKAVLKPVPFSGKIVLMLADFVLKSVPFSGKIVLMLADFVMEQNFSRQNVFTVNISGNKIYYVNIKGCNNVPLYKNKI